VGAFFCHCIQNLECECVQFVATYTAEERIKAGLRSLKQSVCEFHEGYVYHEVGGETNGQTHCDFLQEVMSRRVVAFHLLSYATLRLHLLLVQLRLELDGCVGELDLPYERPDSFRLCNECWPHFCLGR
jgi:hypothetical protein